MSTDFDVVCDACKKRRHLGQMFSSGWAFGYGSSDAETTRAIGDFIFQHSEHGDPRIVHSDPGPEGYADVENKW